MRSALFSVALLATVSSACESEGTTGLVGPDAGVADARDPQDAAEPLDSGIVPMACMRDDDCTEGQYCEFSDNRCAPGIDQPGQCADPPFACLPVEEDPVCGCDGMIYGGVCAANRAGVDISEVPICETPPGRFRCGYRFCERGVRACRITTSGTSQLFDCALVSDECRADPCSCPREDACPTCTVDSEGNATISCAR